MPAAIETNVKTNVIKQWLSGDSRDRIAADNGIGAGTVTNIINEWKKGVEDSDYDSLRELTTPLKKQGIGLNELAPFVRQYIYMKKLGADEDQIESFIANCMNGANSLPPEKIIDLANQLFDISKSESITPVDVPGRIKQKLEEKQRLEEQIQEVCVVLQSKNVDMKTINEYIQLKEHLSKHNLSLEDPTRLLSILQTSLPLTSLTLFVSVIALAFPVIICCPLIEIFTCGFFCTFLYQLVFEP
jgi:transposase